MKNRRDLLILIALFIILVGFTILGPGRQTEDDSHENIPTTHSSGPDGALALLRWSRLLGYDAQRLEYRNFEVNEQVDALIILSPSTQVNRAEARMVLEWVTETGGILIMSNDRSGLFQFQNAILDELDIMVDVYQGNPDVIERSPVLQPVLNTPPFQDALVNTGYVLETERSDVAHLLGVPDGTVLMGVQHGEGYIYLTSSSTPFTNEGLRDSQNGALVLNLLRHVPSGGRILFDEYHHGFFEPPSLRTIVLDAPWGWALIYTLVVLAIYMILTGRRFGRPVPLTEEVKLRSSAEYVESMADLFQRGQKVDFIRRHYYTSFKRRLARPYGINPGLEDEPFVQELSRYREVDQAALRELLNRLQHQNISEKEMLLLLEKLDAQ